MEPAEESDVPPDVRSLIGRWGERYALRCLCQELVAKYPHAVVEDTPEGCRLSADGVEVACVVWLNHATDCGVGYDIEVTEAGCRWYVEVKSTANEARSTFDLSGAQWRAAREHRESYRIMRVYGAGQSRPRATHIRDPFAAWSRGELQIRSMRLVL
jgi:hypothetical protein